ncbi:MAG: hypothetical protein ACE1Y4_04820 [Lysobacterales bacterium]
MKLGVRRQQELEIWLNDMLLFTGKLERARESIELKFDPRLLKTGSENTLSFWFSDPRVASERDRRMLAGKFRSLQLH